MARKSTTTAPADVALTKQEREVMDLRLAGKNFTDIAAEVGYAGPGARIRR